MNDKVDLILTNPPFGARFESAEVCLSFGDNTPFFSSVRRTSSFFDSELLFIDRNLRLLKENGRLLIVIPDGVISARGIAALLRNHLSSMVTVKAVIDLPSVTFAQAGTRTKTAVLYLQKTAPRGNGHSRVFMGVARDLGFQVGSRKGVQVKGVEGQNELPELLEAYKKSGRVGRAKDPAILSKNPSAVLVASKDVTSGSWTPNHYNALRFDSIAEFRKHDTFSSIPLGDLVEFLEGKRKVEPHTEGGVFISVLHVLGEGFLDIRGALDYSPKTPGIEAKPGELLLSRINPRIPRICVVPKLGKKILCSSEFEVMRPVAGLDVYALAYLLQSRVVQDQIRSLTSGTSASHNRIRTSELARVEVPVPHPGSVQAKTLSRISAGYRCAFQSVMKSTHALSVLRGEEGKLFA